MKNRIIRESLTQGEMLMERNNRFSVKRFSALLGIVFSVTAANLFLAINNNVLIDTIVCLVAVNICFILVFALNIIRSRLQNRLPEKVYVDYNKILLTILVSLIVSISFSIFYPAFFLPVIIIPVILSNVLNEGPNITFSLYLVIIISLCQGLSIYTMLSYIVLVLFGLMLSDFLKSFRSIESLFSMILVLALNVLIPIIFYYFAYLEINQNIFIYSVGSGLISCLFICIYNWLINKTIIRSEDNIYNQLLDENYDLVGDIRRYSNVEYKHALRVSRFSQLCAAEIGADEKIAACGGFYYRLGKMEGEPEIDNAIKVANNHCFPTPIIDIIAEYYGVLALPSSKESAIVHMVDSVVTKIELLDSGAMSLNWNQNMVIYQTINENSQNGLYDKSGLSMNDFLKVRDRLANEDILL